MNLKWDLIVFVLLSHIINNNAFDKIKDKTLLDEIEDYCGRWIFFETEPTINEWNETLRVFSQWNGSPLDKFIID